MKKLIILTFFSAVTALGISQPVVNRSANSITVVDARLGGGLNLYTPKYADTTEANLTANRGIDSSGALIYTRNDKKVWIRKHNPKIWIEIGAASAAIDSVLYATRARVQKGIDSVAAVSQPLDADLTTIAGLTATTNNFIVSSSSAWASRTPTQVKTTLAIANTDVSGLGTLSTQNGTFSGTSSGTNTGDETTSRINALYGYTPANGASYFPIAGGSLTGTTNTGYVGFLSQTTAMVAPTEGFKLYDSSGFTLLRADGFRRVLSFSGLTANVKYNFPVGTTNDTVTTNIAPQTLTNKTISGSANAITGIAESSITNLTSDLAATVTKTGVAGGQTVAGGTAANETLTLQSTGNATKGKILFGTSAYDETTNQLGVGTASPDASAKEDIVSTTRGMLIPRMTKAQRDAISSPAQGLKVFVTDDGGYESVYNSGWYPVVKDIASQTYTGTITWTGTTAPSGTETHTYQWTQVGRMVTLRINLKYSVAGVSLTQVTMSLPADCPTPLQPSGLTSASQILYQGSAYLLSTLTTLATNAQRGVLRNNAANNGFEIAITASTTGYISAEATITYWTN